MSLKSRKVLFADGTEGRAFRLNARNNLGLLNRIPGAEFRVQVAKGGQESNHRLMVPVNGTKKIKAAYYDDFVVLTTTGWQVVKFDKTEETIFFVDSEATDKQTQTAFGRWIASLG